MQLHLNTYGAYLHVNEEMFEIRLKHDGEIKKIQVAAHKVKSIWLTTGTALSTNAIRLALRNNIDIVFLENDGMPLGRVWHSKLGSTTLIRKRQLETSLGSECLKYVKQWVGTKMQNQIDFVISLKKHRKHLSDYLDDKVQAMRNLLDQLISISSNDMNSVAEVIRGWEGTCGRLYFETLSMVLPEQYRFNGRSNRPAKDAFNAFLNYAYGVLYSRVEKVLILAGLDPYVGFLHRDDYNYKSMVHDFIEPYRIYADKPVFYLFSTKKVRLDHVTALTNGLALNREGKVLLMEALNRHLEDDKIRYRSRLQSRASSIQFDAHQFANALIGKSDPV